jgi:broad specificity phosphatase PhoE
METQDEWSDTNVFWIRHAHSVAQVAFEHAVKHMPDNIYDNYIEPSLRDAEISDLGLNQIMSSSARTILNSTKIDLVLVSPLKRTMQTAYHLLKDHPEFDSLHFELEPMVREHLHCSSDVASDFPEIIATAKGFFPTLTAENKWARYKNPWMWQAEDQMPAVYEGILEKIEECGGNVCEGIFKYQLTDHPDTIERVEYVLHRVRHAREIIKAKHQELTTKLGRPAKIVVVTHKIFSKCFLSKSFKELGQDEHITKVQIDPERHFPDDGVWLNNCQLINADEYIF